MNNGLVSEPYMSIMLKRLDEINEKLGGLNSALDNKVMQLMGPEPETLQPSPRPAPPTSCLRDIIEDKLDTTMSYLNKLGYLQGNLNRFV